jgi:hypothetical protein
LESCCFITILDQGASAFGALEGLHHWNHGE